MRRALEHYGGSFVAILILMVVGIASAVYVLIEQRLRTPFQESYPLRAEFTAANAVTPGLGQPVNVAGVKVGQVSDVELEDGVAVVSMEIDPNELPRVHSDAQASLKPNTPLKDMQIELYPGSRSARVISPDGLIKVARTDAPVDHDELLAALDSDTRTFFTALIGGTDIGLRDRGEDLRQLFESLGPTAEQAQQITSALAERRREIRRLVHNLGELTRAAGTKDRELRQTVSAANQTLQALAAEEPALRESVARLPGTLRATRGSLVRATGFVGELVPTLEALTPGARRLPAALRALAPVADEGRGIIGDGLRPLVRDLQPVAADLNPATRDLIAQTPHLTRAIAVLQYVANELGYNPPGDNEGFLFWLGWFSHNAASVFSTEDAHGAVWRGLSLISCSTFEEISPLRPVFELLAGPTPCSPPTASGTP